VGEKINIALAFKDAGIAGYARYGVGVNKPVDGIDVCRVKHEFDHRNFSFKFICIDSGQLAVLVKLQLSAKKTCFIEPAFSL
jgi:hypothetical protein